MNRGFTWVEVIIVCVIIVIVSSIAVTCHVNMNYSYSDEDYEELDAIWNPKQAAAKAQQKMARELERQNDLKERELNMKLSPEKN